MTVTPVMTPAKIKICGVTRADDATMVVTAGADFIGLNFWPTSKRYLDPVRAPMIAAAARASGSAKIVGVFVGAGAADVNSVLERVQLDIIQLHGDENPEDELFRQAVTGKAGGDPEIGERLDPVGPRGDVAAAEGGREGF